MLRDANLQVNEKNFHTSSFMQFALIFFEYITITIYFRKYKRKVVSYLFNNDSSKSTFFMLNVAFDVLLSAVCVK